jgi:hypothetical protein
MPLIEYVAKEFSNEHLAVIGQANLIIERYRRAGFDLTIRQLYYQFVAAGLIPNEERSYKRIIDIMGQARLAGLVDWEAIVDRTRNLARLPHWDNPADIVRDDSKLFHLDRWDNQAARVEVWCEKEALAGVLERVCTPLDVPYFSCRGYASLSEMWAAAERLIEYQERGQQPVILYLGDHDPSGIDMTRDITERLVVTFGATDAEVVRLALNMDQIRQFNPPPNPAKLSDSRASGYIARFGPESWELDAMNPTDIANLIESEIRRHMDEDLYDEKVREEAAARQELATIADNYEAARAAACGDRRRD